MCAKSTVTCVKDCVCVCVCVCVVRVLCVCVCGVRASLRDSRNCDSLG